MVNLLKSGIKTLGRATRTGLDNISGAFQNPITFISKPKEYLNPKTTREIFRRDTQGARIVKTGGTLLTAGSLVLTGGSSGFRSAAVRTIPKLIPKSTIGRTFLGTGAAVATPIIAGQIISNPIKAGQSVERGLGSFGNFQQNLFNLGRQPTKQNLMSTIKENPGLATLAAIGLAAPIATSIPAGIGFVGGELAAKLNKDKPLESADIPTPTATGESSSFQGTDNTSFSSTPVAAGTEDISKPKYTKVYRKRTKKKTIQPIRLSQRVDVRVNAANKRYLNKHIHIKQ